MAYLPDPVLALAGKQFMVVTVRDLLTLDLGGGRRVTRPMIDGWLARGYLEPIHRGVYRIAGTAGLPEQRHYAAIRRAGKGARAGGPTVLAFLGVEGFELDGEDEPFVVIEPGRQLTGVAFHWLAAPVPSGDAVTLPGGVPGVIPARALVESTGVVARKRVRVGYDDLRRRGLLYRARFVEKAHQLIGVVPGAETALEIAGSGELDKESEGERELSTVFLPTDPWPLWQVRVLEDVRLDSLFPEARLAPEYYGGKHHSIDVDRRYDRARAARLRSEIGIEVLEVWKDDLRDRRALRERILGRRAARLREGVTPLRDFQLDRR